MIEFSTACIQKVERTESAGDCMREWKEARSQHPLSVIPFMYFIALVTIYNYITRAFLIVYCLP